MQRSNGRRPAGLSAKAALVGVVLASPLDGADREHRLDQGRPACPAAGAAGLPLEWPGSPDHFDLLLALIVEPGCPGQGRGDVILILTGGGSPVSVVRGRSNAIGALHGDPLRIASVADLVPLVLRGD